MSSILTLAIDTSCDDTSIAVVHGTRVLSNVISSQDQVHKEYGGVVPMLAKREHETNFSPVLSQALTRAGVTKNEIQQVAITKGPGLAPALEIGLMKAQELADLWKMPIVGINHLEGHLWSAAAQTKTGQGGWIPQESEFPLLGLVVSGGHTEMYWVTGLGEYQHLGGTVDDAFGEAFDKVARLIGLGYPGGSTLALLANTGNPHAYPLPRAMRFSGDLNVSYSGLKTAMVRLVEKITDNFSRPLTQQEIKDLAASFEQAAVETLTGKIAKILAQRQPKHILLGGGASANILLRKTLRQLARKFESQLHVPSSKKLLRDNAAMIGVVANLRHAKNLPTQTSLDRLPRWPLEELSSLLQT